MRREIVRKHVSHLAHRRELTLRTESLNQSMILVVVEIHKLMKAIYMPANATHVLTNSVMNMRARTCELATHERLPC